MNNSNNPFQLLNPFGTPSLFRQSTPQVTTSVNQTPMEMCRNVRRVKLRKVMEIIKDLMTEIDELEAIIRQQEMMGQITAETWER